MSAVHTSAVRFLSLVSAIALLATLAKAQDKDAAPPIPQASLIPLDAPVVISLRPQALLKDSQIKTVYDDFIKMEEIKKVVDIAEPESVEEISIILLARDAKIEDSPGEWMVRNGAVIVRTNKPREWKALAAAAQVPVVKATHVGQDYFRFSGEAPSMFGFYQPSETTVIAASEANLQKMIEGIKAGNEAKPPKIAGASNKTAAAIALDMSWLRDLVNPLLKAQNQEQVILAMSVVNPIWEKTTYATARIDVSGAQKFTVSAENLCADEDGALSVEKTVEAILTLTRNVMPQFSKLARVESQNNPTVNDLLDMAEGALKGLTLEREGTRVRLTVPVRADVAKLKVLMLGK